MSTFANHSTFAYRLHWAKYSGFILNGKADLRLVSQDGRACRPSVCKAVRLEAESAVAYSEEYASVSQLHLLSCLISRTEEFVAARKSGRPLPRTTLLSDGEAPTDKVAGSDVIQRNRQDCIQLSTKEIILACAFISLGASYFIDIELAKAANLHSEVSVRSVLPELALGNGGGPLVEEFWENMRRYGLYFITVATGGIYSLLKPLSDLLKNPVSAVLLVVVLSSSFYLLYLTLATMLGIMDFNYEYSS